MFIYYLNRLCNLRVGFIRSPAGSQCLPPPPRWARRLDSAWDFTSSCWSGKPWCFFLIFWTFTPPSNMLLTPQTWMNDPLEAEASNIFFVTSNFVVKWPDTGSITVYAPIWSKLRIKIPSCSPTRHKVRHWCTPSCLTVLPSSL